MSPTATPGVLAPQGELTMLSAPAWLEAGRQLAAAGDIVVDFGAVTQVDSAALSLLLDWLRSARAAGHRLDCRNLPPALLSLAALYDLGTVLPQEEGA